MPFLDDAHQEPPMRGGNPPTSAGALLETLAQNARRVVDEEAEPVDPVIHEHDIL